MYEWDLCDDFYKFTDVQVKRSEGLSEMLCAICEDVLNKCISFRTQCMRSDLIMRDKQVVEVKNLQEQDCLPIVKAEEKLPQDLVNSVRKRNEIIFNMSFPQMDSKMRIPCAICKKIFYKPKVLITHLKEDHQMSQKVLFHYYCPYLNCNYFIDSGKDKYFNERKYLNQHLNKVHAPRTLTCVNCKATFPRESDLHRHIKVCSQIFKCHDCGISYSRKEPYLVHLLRKHPEAHKKYKEDKILKRTAETALNPKVNEQSYDELVKSVSEFICPRRAKVVKDDVENGFDGVPELGTGKGVMENESDHNEVRSVSDFITYCPKRSRLLKPSVDMEDEPNDIIDMSFPNLDNLDSSSNMDSEAIDTSKELEELLSIKNQTNNGQFFFDPDLDFEDTKRDCESPRTNFVKSLFDSPERPTGGFMDSETQTQFSPDLKKDVMLSFATAETQTYFDQELAYNNSL